MKARIQLIIFKFAGWALSKLDSKTIVYAYIPDEETQLVWVDGGLQGFWQPVCLDDLTSFSMGARNPQPEAKQ